MLKNKVYEIFQNISLLQQMIEYRHDTYNFTKGVKATLIEAGKREFDYDTQEEQKTYVVYKLTDGDETLHVKVNGEFWSYDGLKATDYEFVTAVEKMVTVFEKV